MYRMINYVCGTLCTVILGQTDSLTLKKSTLCLDWILLRLKVMLDKSSCQINKCKYRLNGKTAVYIEHVEIEHQSQRDQVRLFDFETTRFIWHLVDFCL